MVRLFSLVEQKKKKKKIIGHKKLPEHFLSGSQSVSIESGKLFDVRTSSLMFPTFKTIPHIADGDIILKVKICF